MTLPDEVKAWRKAERERLIAARMALPGAERRAVRERVCALLANEAPELVGAVVGFYSPFRAEINLMRFMSELIGKGTVAALPVIVAKRQPLEFWRWAPGAEMRPGVWDIPVPAVPDPVVPDCLLVPLVGFDAGGYRLGYGGGYYDRTIAALPRRPLAIGVGFAFQKLPSIMPQSYDRPMDAIVTEDGIVWHRRPVRGANRSAIASPEEDPNVEPIECSSPPCFLHELRDDY